MAIGKVVVIQHCEGDLKALLKDLKVALGTGGVIREDTVEVSSTRCSIERGAYGKGKEGSGGSGGSGVRRARARIYIYMCVCVCVRVYEDAWWAGVYGLGVQRVQMGHDLLPTCCHC